MSTLIFENTDKLKKLVKKTINSDLFSIPYTDQTTNKKSVCLVKDHGIYIMDNYLDDDPRNSTEKGTVIYARGYDLEQPNLWDKTHHISADDFADIIPLTDTQLTEIINGADLVIHMTETRFTISTVGGTQK